MILGDLIPAFEGISKIIPNSIPAVDSAVLFTYAPTAVVVGFVVSFIGGILGMLALGAMGMVVIIPGLVAHFLPAVPPGFTECHREGGVPSWGALSMGWASPFYRHSCCLR